MGSYASIAERDRWGNIIGYRSTSTGEMIEWTGAASEEFQRIMHRIHGYEDFMKEHPEFLEID